MMAWLKSTWTRRILCSITFALCAAGSALFCFVPNGGGLDYPIQVISVQRILRGETPYRDFQVLYGPLGHYFAAAVVWPLRFLAPATAMNCFYYLSTLIFFGLVIGLTLRIPRAQPLMFLGALAAILVNVPTLAPESYYSLPALLPVFLALALAIPALDADLASFTTKTWCQVGVGALVAVAFFTRINFGIYLGIALGLTGILAWILEGRKAALNALKCIVLAVVFTCLIAIGLAVAGIFRPAIIDMQSYLPRASAGRKAPWRSYADHRFLATYVLICALFILRFPLRLAERRADGMTVSYLMLCAFISYSYFRFDSEHAYPAIALLLVLMSDLGASRRRRSPPSYGFSQSSIVDADLLLQCVQIVAVLVLARGYLGLNMGERRTLRPTVRYWTRPQSRPVILNGVPVSPPELILLQHIAALKRPEELIYWASIPGSCQATTDLCVDLSLYLAGGSLPKPRNWFFDTASTPFADTQLRIIDDLDRDKIPWIGMQGEITPSLSLVAYPEQHLLENYVKTHYVVRFVDDIPELNDRFVIYSIRGNR